MISKHLFGALIGFALLCVAPLSLADDWDTGDSFSSQDALKEKAAQEFFAQDRVMQRSPQQREYRSSRRVYREQPVDSEPRYSRKVSSRADDDNYSRGLPSSISTNEKVVIVDPNIHSWGAYANGKLIHSGLATAGSKWCEDIGRPCKTKAGTFRVYSLGSEDCVSSIYPIDEGGGAPMPYCMYFNGSQGLHGSDHVVRGNISHGCVRLRVSDAEWLRFNFVNIGTKVIIRPY